MTDHTKRDPVELGDIAVLASRAPNRVNLPLGQFGVAILNSHDFARPADVVQPVMLAPCHHLKVRESVVGLVMILVMHNFAALQLAAKVPFHDDSVPESVSPVDINDGISLPMGEWILTGAGHVG